MSTSDRRGLIVARHRRELIVLDENRQSWQGLLHGRRIKPLTGDEVRFRIDRDGTVVVEKILPRATLLSRIDNRGRPEGIAANVSLLAIVVGPEPVPDWALVDRYLVAAELQGLGAALIRNKADIADEPLDQRLAAYAAIGYRTLTTSTIDGTGLADLAKLISGHRAVLVGQSGVGKSSLLNALIETDEQAVRGLSRRRALGRHTTTASTLWQLPGGGELIDSPGVRRYAPSIDTLAKLDRGFIEFRAWLGHCRFNDCRHREEPDCAVRAAVDRGEVDRGRYESYLALREALERLS